MYILMMAFIIIIGTQSPSSSLPAASAVHRFNTYIYSTGGCAVHHVVVLYYKFLVLCVCV